MRAKTDEQARKEEQRKKEKRKRDLAAAEEARLRELRRKAREGEFAAHDAFPAISYTNTLTYLPFI